MTSENPTPETAKNVIFMLPDGASTSYLANYRYFKEGPDAPVWEPLLKGMVQTDSLNNPITDSAAGANAYATGVKTRNGSVGVDFFGNELTSVTDLASDAGKATGIVSTAAVTDASPAAFGASNPLRGNQADIAQQYIGDNQLDVVLGAGRNQFTTESEGGTQPDGTDLFGLAEQQGMTYVSNAQALANFDGERVLGLFNNEDYLDAIGERPAEEPSLAQMTEVALSTLSKDKDGFVLFLEEENTDTFGHSNDAATTMHALSSFEASMQKVLEFQEANPDTLVVMVADHDTGGMTVQPAAEASPAVFRDFTETAEGMAEQFDAANATSIRDTVDKYTGLTLSDDEITGLQGSEDIPLALAELLSAKGGVEFTTTGHTAADVPIFAVGPGADLFTGVQENSAVGQHIAEAMGMSLPLDQQNGGADRLAVTSLFDSAFGSIPAVNTVRNLVTQLGDESLDSLADRLSSFWSGLDNTEFLSSVLENTLDTAPEAADLAYWGGFLAANGGDRGDVLLQISELPAHREALLELPVSEAEFSPIA
ncbi:alkaline phosphatase [Belnapia rosea]|uniref:Alkaline phosphatase n=1 Tax=Belnapia rosea TaxID=938405 RepID=A0A1G7CG71_9PROT|nr:alkaline phosphatase [Belnapia rosea]SDB74692.1 alkaline phosphatase [Belnapia rosea]SDE38261.1 alkaline phosphatase [Belnapia rosea]